ncbi:MAG: hypothetical protein AB1730_05590 [Myxococcota bacterium]|jgi:hypothetical protein
MSVPEPKDPRFRPFRTAAWGLYLVVAVGFSSLVVYSVFRSVVAMTPKRPAASGQALPVPECVAQARALLDRLDAQRRDFSQPAATRADQRFLGFRDGWLKDKRALEARCGLEDPGREKLTEAFDELERLLDLYTTSSVQYAGAVAPTLESLRERLDEAGR